MERLFAVRQVAYAAAQLRIDARARPEDVAERIIEAVS
jgi:hypothetical protein